MKNQVNSSATGLVTLTPAELMLNGGCECWGPIAVGGAINIETGETIAVLYGPPIGPCKPHPAGTLPGSNQGVFKNS